MIDPAQYRTYRSHLAPLYAQRAVNDLAPKLHKNLLSSATKMEGHIKTGEAVNMVKVLRTLSVSSKPSNCPKYNVYRPSDRSLLDFHDSP